LFADEFIGRQAFERFQSPTEVIGADEGLKMTSELIVAVVVKAFHGCVFDRAVHPLDLTIGPGMPDFGEPVINLMLVADTVKDMRECGCVAFLVRELDAPHHCLSNQWHSNGSIGQHDVDAVRNRSNKIAQEICGSHFPRFGMQFDISKLRRTVDADKEMKLAFSRLNLSNINVKLGPVDVHLSRMIVAAIEMNALKLASVLHERMAIPRFSLSFPK